MTLPTGSHVAGRELARRLAQFRHELHAAGDTPDRRTIEALVARVRALGLEEAEVGEDLEQLRAALEGTELDEAIARGEMPVIVAPDSAIHGDVAHFACAARFGRRRTDQTGRLVLTTTRLEFRGALDMSVAWSEVAAVRRNGRELLIALRHSPKALRLACPTHSDAARAGVIARHLASDGEPAARFDLSGYAGT